jgi:hypothetical protein
MLKPELLRLMTIRSYEMSQNQIIIVFVSGKSLSLCKYSLKGSKDLFAQLKIGDVRT